MKRIPLFVFVLSSIVAYGQIESLQSKPLNWTGIKEDPTVDTIPKVYYINKDKTNRDAAIVINGTLANQTVMETLEPKMIDSVHVEKQDFEIDGKKYYGKIRIQMKPGYRPNYITLNALREKYLNKDERPVIFFVDEKLVTSNYNDFLVDEKYILKIVVESLDNPDEKLGLNVIRLVTKTEENIRKSKQIMIR